MNTETATATVETYIPGQKLTPEQVEAWAIKYETTGKLPSPKVPCSTGCGVETTMFGDNLHKRVAKFGGIRVLLLNFKSRSARQTEKVQALLAKAAGKSATTVATSTALVVPPADEDLTGGLVYEE